MRLYIFRILELIFINSCISYNIFKFSKKINLKNERLDDIDNKIEILNSDKGFLTAYFPCVNHILWVFNLLSGDISLVEEEPFHFREILHNRRDTKVTLIIQVKNNLKL